jgi:excisionase family DNA binding protein
MKVNDSTNIEKWSSLKDITEYLGVSREAIFQWIENRGMPGHKVGRLWKFKISEIDEWIKSGKSGDLSGESENKSNADDGEKD